MWKFAVIVLLLAAIALPSALFATQERGTETRISAYKHDDGRIEFALQVREGSGWSTRIEPDVNILPTSAAAGRWYVSSSVNVVTPSTESHMTAEEDEATEEATTQDENEERGNVGPLYEWTWYHPDGDGGLSRHRVEWSSWNVDGSKHLRVTIPYRVDKSPCNEHPCRYELQMWCGEELGLVVLLRKWWMFNSRVPSWTSEERRLLGWENRMNTRRGRITTSIDHSSFAADWQVYEPRGQNSAVRNATYGGDFILEGEAAHAFLRRVQSRDSLSVTVNHRYQDDDAFTLDLTGAFDNPAVRELKRCEMRE